MNKKFLLAVFLIGIVLATVVVEVRAINASTVTLTLGNNANNPSTQYPADAYSLFTLNQTMIYNDIVQTQYPTDGLVGVQIQDPNGATMVIRTLQTGTTIPDSIPITISEAFLCNSGEQNITSITIPSGTNLFVPQIYFTVYNNQATAQSLIVTLNVYDSNGIPFPAVSQVMPNVPAYTSKESTLNFYIPSWAHYGTATAYVDVYTAMPNNNGYPLGKEYNFPFTITGGTAYQGLQPMTQSKNGSPTNFFSMSFRLPQYSDVTLGAFTVTSTANYLGVMGSETTPFSVQEFADVNGDSAVNFNDITNFVALYINYFANHVYSPQIDFIHDGSVINFNDVALFVAYYIQAWSS